MSLTEANELLFTHDGNEVSRNRNWNITHMNTQHLVHVLDGCVKTYGDKVALRTVGESTNRVYSWQQFGDKAIACANALLQQGVGVQDKVGIFARNMPEWTIADIATLKCRGVVVPIYPTNTQDQTRYIIENAGIRILFVGEQAQYDVAIELLKADVIEKVIILSPDVQWQPEHGVTTFTEFCEKGTSVPSDTLQERLNQTEMSDLVTLIYTSGTTGNPKGVMLDYTNFASCNEVNVERVPVGPSDVSFCFLPLSHVFERAWTLYCLTFGVENVYLRETAEVMNLIGEVKPTVMCTVPRLFEKVFAAVKQKMAKESAVKQKLFHWAMHCGKQHFISLKRNQPMGPLQRMQYRIADKLILSKLRDVFGGNIRYIPCSGAALSDEVARFIYYIGLRTIYGYGATETTATVSCFHNYDFEFGEIGTPMKGLQVKIADDGEICIKGNTVMRGYYNNPEATAEVLDKDGWFHSGDAGRLNAEGRLHFTERLKELMKTSNGKYVAPQWIEGIISQDPYIEQIVVIADSRNFVSALIVPCYESLEEYAKQLEIKYSHRKELLDHQKIKEFFDGRVEEMQAQLAKFEKVKRFSLLPEAFSMETGELTPTMKLRRKVIERKYNQLIEAMYK